eukprot:SAG31_NODE_26644_length_439_cov_0.461765_2_plen_42_part_01
MQPHRLRHCEPRYASLAHFQSAHHKSSLTIRFSAVGCNHQDC